MEAGRVERVWGLAYINGYFRALAYGQSQEAAVSKVQALALRVLLNGWSTAKLALSSDMSTRVRKPRRRHTISFVVCVENSGYPASLERHKIYRVLPDQDAAREGDLRVVDESGEDYLYPAEWFAAVEVPRRVRAPLLGRPARLQSAYPWHAANGLRPRLMLA
jgi:hypothetical protein